MTAQSDVTIDELGPVDYLVVEFPLGAQNFQGEVAEELLRLTEQGTIRVLDMLLLQKNLDGSVEALEVGDAPGLDEIRSLEADLAVVLAGDDVEHLAAAMEPGSVALALVWENCWAAPFGSAARRAGGQLVASGRIPIQAIAASLESENALEGGN